MIYFSDFSSSGGGGADTSFAQHLPEGFDTGTLMIPKGTGSDWDSGGVREIGNILHDPTDTGKEYKMCYTGYAGAHVEGNEYVGAAYSADGLTWTKYSSVSPLVSRKSEDPYLLKDGSTYHLYVEDKEDTPFRNIRLFTSTDFASWTDQGDVLDIGETFSWEGVDVSSPVVWKEGSTWHMLYEGRKDTTQLGAIGHATSSDGITWTKDPRNPIIVGTNAAWSYAGVTWADSIVPDELLIIDGLLILYFHGQRISDDAYVPGVAVGRDIYSFEDVNGGNLDPYPGDGDIMALPMFSPRQFAYPVPSTGVYRAAGTSPATSPPSFSANPVISQADGFVGVGDVLSCTEGTHNGLAPGYQWRRDGVAISDATDATYTLVVGDLGAVITCTVTVVNSGGGTSATSNSLGPVVTPSFTNEDRVTDAAEQRVTSTSDVRIVAIRTA